MHVGGWRACMQGSAAGPRPGVCLPRPGGQAAGSQAPLFVRARGPSPPPLRLRPRPRPPAPPLQVYVQCPKVDGSDSLTGQLLAVEMPSLLASVSELKARLSEALSLPPGKQQLSREHVGILKNELTLAFYNVAEDVHLQLGIKERGGRKK